MLRTLTALTALALLMLPASLLAPVGANAQTWRAHTQSFHDHHTVHTRRHHKHRRHHHHRRRHHHLAVKHRASAHHADSGGCANTTLRPTPDNLQVVREATLCLVNRERVTHGEHALKLNDKLQHTAQGHSESMAFNDYFGHEGPGNSTPLSRMRAAGYIYSSRIGYEIGENIAWGTLWLATPKAIVDSWMQSPGHRANILDPGFRDTGIGVSPHALASRANGQAGGIYTQDFGVIIAG